MTWREARDLLTESGRGVNDAQDILDDLARKGPDWQGFSVRTEFGVRWLRYAGLRPGTLQPQYTTAARQPGEEGEGDTMTTDEIEGIRRAMIATGQPQEDLAQADQTWTTQQLQEEFEVRGFAAPFVTVRRRSDGQLGSLEFTHNPRVYFNWEPYSDM